MSRQRIVFVDRDGTLIAEPPDFQIDAYEKLRFVDGVIPAMLKLRDAGFQFVLVTNQDGLGTASFPRESFEGPQALMLQVLASQGIVFREILIDESFEHEGKPTRKPGLGLLMHYLRDRSIDLAGSAVVGDRDTDLQLAANLGCRGYKLAPGPDTWDQVAHELADAPRVATIERVTKETRVRVRLDLDRAADPEVSTGLGFFDHMLEQLGKHGGFALQLTCAGDLHIDEHHTVEDSALALGQALREALADKRGIGRYGDSSGQGAITLPMDETLASAAVDLSGRPYFVFEGSFPRPEVGGLATELVPHFFRSLCETAGLNLHLQVRGENTHHMVEACFKAVARALRQAIRREGRELPSTKGTL
ncbi:bifunctional histidinol-phosphatase/imidazoleglycerol-phosphate dehydratase HisB [Arenimonas sp. MALMAid1274]|uniref:bifunctional histidinol-phosphatase/imidazoleglycerol-phosphate dehydratase HisB n=1 Tax=Arenimonas sp. MALMAid1274 TaxID=3411630 RepID=UPI003BA1B40C